MELEIPVQDIGKGETLHQLAAKKTVTELEESRGWIHFASDAKGELIKNRCESQMDELVQQECERLGVRYQVAGKHCSFVAVLDDDILGYESGSNDTDDIPSHEGQRVRSACRKRKMAKYTRRRSTVVPFYDMDLGVEEPESDEDMGFICVSPRNTQAAAFDPENLPVSSFNLDISGFPGPSDSDIEAILGFDSTTPGFSPTSPKSPSIASLAAGFSPTASISPPLGPSSSRARIVSHKKWPELLHNSAVQPPAMKRSLKMTMTMMIQAYIHQHLYPRRPCKKLSFFRPSVAIGSSTTSCFRSWALIPTRPAPISMIITRSRRVIRQMFLRNGLTILATALVGHFLEKKSVDSKDEWELFKMKADDWVQRQVRAMGSEDNYFVMRFIQSFGSYF